MLVWKNTSTLDDFDEGIKFTDDKSKADIALIGSKPFDIENFPSLKGIFRAGIGKDNVPEQTAKKRNILVRYPSKSTINIIFNETASFTCSLIFRMLYHGLGTIEPWHKENRRSLSSKKLLVVGNGNIGKRVAQRMSLFMSTKTFDIRDNDIEDLPKLIENADCISIHIPKTKENNSFFDKEKLALMKKNSILVNTSRGSLVDENALYNEITNGRLRAAFDVFWEEPYQGKLRKINRDNFYMTPHIASTCNDFLLGCRKGLDNLMSEIND